MEITFPCIVQQKGRWGHNLRHNSQWKEKNPVVNGCGLVSPDLITAKTSAPAGVNVGMDSLAEVYEVAIQRMGHSQFLSTLLGKTQEDAVFLGDLLSKLSTAKQTSSGTIYHKPSFICFCWPLKLSFFFYKLSNTILDTKCWTCFNNINMINCFLKQEFIKIYSSSWGWCLFLADIIFLHNHNSRLIFVYLDKSVTAKLRQNRVSEKYTEIYSTLLKYP